MRLGVVAVLMLVWSAACAPATPMPEAAPPGDSEAQVPGEPQTGGASLEVENNSTADVRIFVLRGSMPTRLGLVSGMSTATFELRPQLIDREIRLYATPVGGTQRARTDMFRVRAGQLVSWKLDNRLRSDRLSVY